MLSQERLWTSVRGRPSFAAMKKISIHPFVVWGIPVLLMIAQLLSEALLPDQAKPAFFSEEGPHEKFQALIVWVAFYFSVRIFFRAEGLWLRLWYGIALLGCLFIGGEEISWGQTYLQWATPDSWMAINDQGETNFHNTSDWLDQKPKILLQIGVLVGGLIIPAYQKWKPEKLPARFAAIYPTWHVVPAAGFAFAVKLIDTIQDRLDQHLFWRASEVLEIYIYYFIFMYLLVMWRMMNADKALKPAQE